MTYDVAIIGSSFAGSLLAILARRMGKSVVLLERGQHPRFVIGESSTPLANLLLEELADRYDLPWLRPFSKWGTWQSCHPEIPCGLKRGFSFYFHQPGQLWKPQASRDNELLVAASPNDALADTHWFRPDFDAHFVRMAMRSGVSYVDQISLAPPRGRAGAWELSGERLGTTERFAAAYLVDGSGPLGYLTKAWNMAGKAPGSAPLATQSLYTHFTGVKQWSDWSERSLEDATAPPFPPDDAALHHVFPGGWIWVLRFNNGVVSAGCAVTDDLATELRLEEGAAAWARLMERFPGIGAQFRAAQPVQKFTYRPRLSAGVAQTTGPGWCLLPGSAGFVDPLLSTGFVLNLLGLERLAAIWERGGEPGELNYNREVLGDLNVTADLVRGLYQLMANPTAFRDLLQLYFAAASYAETARRLGRPEVAPGFLLRHHPTFHRGFDRCLKSLDQGGAKNIGELVGSVIQEFDVAGLSAPGKRNWYPCDAADLFNSAAKLGVGTVEIAAMLKRVGFSHPAAEDAV